MPMSNEVITHKHEWIRGLSSMGKAILSEYCKVAIVGRFNFIPDRV